MKINLWLILFFSSFLYAQFDNGLHLSAMMGCSFSGRSPLQIQLADGRRESISADYNNRCVDDSHWWSFRLENWQNQSAWGLEITHHKIYLKNTTDLIESFSISDGYNLVLFNLAKQYGRVNYRVGIGAVLGHVDVTIAGRERFIRKGLDGYYLTGPAFQLNVERILWESDYHFISLDSKFTAAYAKVAVSANRDEYAVAPDFAVHMSLAVGSKPARLQNKPWLYGLPLVYPRIVGAFLGTGLLP
jgi:hypothetical protein